MTEEVAKKGKPKWIDKIDWEEYEKLSAVYTAQSLATYLNVPQKEFMREFQAIDSELKYHYDRGRLLVEMQETVKMIDSSCSGNATQGQRLDKKRKEKEFEAHKQRIMYGEEI